MAGNGYDNGQGAADPRRGWAASGGYDGSGYDGGGAPVGEPEYFGAPPQGYEAAPGAYEPAPGAYDPNQAGHTRAFSVEDEQYYSAAPAGPPGGLASGQDNVAVYRAGGQAAPHQGGPRLGWKELLTGIYRAPAATFDRMRDHQVWLPALTVSLLYGMLAVLGIGLTKDEVVNSTFTVALSAMAGAAIGFTLAGAMLGAVTHGLARQLGGDGPWQSTVGLAVIIGWTSDAPRLLLALFLPADNVVVQVLGWATWLLCAGLLTTMVRRVHDLPWGKAAGAAALQLLALLVLIKLPTLG
ncbi:Yip1 family protein [Kitasatospora sp. NPDC002040]|uniref:Yip1 family protein n=1 Tax=Kitasatospora sp. NPDC002040 TaxID=3154661 RepID=UPI003329D5F5